MGVTPTPAQESGGGLRGYRGRSPRQEGVGERSVPQVQGRDRMPRPHCPRRPLDPARREALILRHLPLVRHVAGRMVGSVPASLGVDSDDLVGYGTEGLIAAVDTFNPAYHVRFSTWAVLHIRTTIQDALRTLDPLPRSLRAKDKAIERASAELANAQGQWPAAREVAAALGVPLAQLRTTLQQLRTVTVSLDEGEGEDADGDDQGGSWAAGIADDDPAGDPQAALDEAETRRIVRAAVDRLPAPEATIIRQYYEQGCKVRVIAAALGVTESRVSQLHSRARGRLRAALACLVLGEERTERAVTPGAHARSSDDDGTGVAVVEPTPLRRPCPADPPEPERYVLHRVAGLPA